VSRSAARPSSVSYAHARKLLGPSAFLAPEHKIVLSTDIEAARARGREAIAPYLNLDNYLNRWKRLGFTDEDPTKPGGDRLVDAVMRPEDPKSWRNRRR
jgi:hypothetical protein